LQIFLLRIKEKNDYNPSVFRTLRFAISSNFSRFSRNIFAASTFAGLASLGSASKDTTESKIFSILCTGLQRSALVS
jgi:hypothetical protein